ncbi:MAG: c-type cytochrome [Acidobacteria bacterium]|nr:c-type cytochrome [Acidobacteriota bacterium]MCL5286997.1 c-type cytochrome [Acidobacteriota bacterium]
MRNLLSVCCLLLLCAALGSAARDENDTKSRRSSMAGAPTTAAARANPYEGNPDAAKAGRKLFLRHCAECHGEDLRGVGKAPALDSDQVTQAPGGELFWFLTNGNLRSGMPAWSGLPEQKRWQIVTYLKLARKMPAQ